MKLVIKVNKNLQLIAPLLFAGVVIFGATYVMASSSFSPEWSTLQKMGRDQTANLNGFSPGVRSSAAQQSWVNPHIDQNLKIRYSDAVGRYSLRKKAGTANVQDEVEYQAQLRQLSRDYLSEVQRNQIRIHTKQLKKHVENTESFDGIKKHPIAVAGFIVGVGMGAPLRLKLGALGLLRARMSAVRNRAELNLSNSLFHSTIFYDGRADTEAVQDVSQPLPGGDRTRIQVASRLPGLDIQSGVTYGTQSKLMNAELSRELLPNVAAAVGTTMSTVSGSSERNIRLSYGLQF